MLIVTSQATRDPVGLLTGSGWSGPCAFVALPDHGFRQAGLRSLEDRLTVFEWLNPPASSTSLICGVVTRLAHLLSESSWPLLFVATPTTASEVASCERSGIDRRHIVEASEEAGRLDRLLLGIDVIGHPLARDFFDFMKVCEIADGRFPPLIMSSLVGERG